MQCSIVYKGEPMIEVVLYNEKLDIIPKQEGIATYHHTLEEAYNWAMPAIKQGYFATFYDVDL